MRKRLSRSRPGAVPAYHRAHGLRDLRGDAVAKFWSKLDRNMTVNECWEWRGYTKAGYGVLSQRIGPRHLGKIIKIPAHRVSYELHNGTIPKGRIVRHTCRNARCVNPKHLILGTHADNMRDMREAGRSLTNERNPKAKLTAKQVDAIMRARRGISPTPLKILAKEYGVHLATIDYAARGGTWSGCKEPPVATRQPKPRKAKT